jgi:undecaprenyl-diphosphatase
MLEKLIYLDTVITNFLKNLLPNNFFFDLFFSFFSLKGNAIFVWILVIIIALFLEEKKHPGISKNDKKFILAFTLSFLLTAFLVEYPLKNFFNRQRPILTNLNQLQLVSTNYCPTDFSFPSGHAATAFSAATVLTFFDKKRRFFYSTIAFLIAYSRIYLGCHYFLDVLGGGVLGFFVAKILLSKIK